MGTVPVTVPLNWMSKSGMNQKPRWLGFHQSQYAPMSIEALQIYVARDLEGVAYIDVDRYAEPTVTGLLCWALRAFLHPNRLTDPGGERHESLHVLPSNWLHKGEVRCLDDLIKAHRFGLYFSLVVNLSRRLHAPDKAPLITRDHHYPGLQLQLLQLSSERHPTIHHCRWLQQWLRYRFLHGLA